METLDFELDIIIDDDEKYMSINSVNEILSEFGYSISVSDTCAQVFLIPLDFAAGGLN